MAATYIQVTLADFEAQFNLPRKDDPHTRAFELVRPPEAEAYYLCKLREEACGVLYLKVLTSIRGDRQAARNVGEDAIRCCLYWKDEQGWEAGLGSAARVYRSGGEGKTARDVVARALKRARELAGNSRLPRCPRCARPMVKRESKHGEFWGCIGWGDKRARCGGVRQVLPVPVKASQAEAPPVKGNHWPLKPSRRECQAEGEAREMEGGQR